MKLNLITKMHWYVCGGHERACMCNCKWMCTCSYVVFIGNTGRGNERTRPSARCAMRPTGFGLRRCDVAGSRRFFPPDLVFFYARASATTFDHLFLRHINFFLLFFFRRFILHNKKIFLSKAVSYEFYGRFLFRLFRFQWSVWLTCQKWFDVLKR